MTWYEITALAMTTFAVGAFMGHAAGYYKGKHLKRKSAPAEEVARNVWETSSFDEGTISAMGADIVASGLLAEFDITAKEKK